MSNEIVTSPELAPPVGYAHAVVGGPGGRTVHLGGDRINFTVVAGPPNVHDMERGRRSGNYRDYCDLYPATKGVVHHLAKLQEEQPTLATEDRQSIDPHGGPQPR